MTTDLTFITNEENNKLVDRFAALIKDSQYFDCLVGYFYTSGFHSLYRSLENTETIKTKTWLNDEITPYELYLKFLYEYLEERINLDLEDVGDLFRPPNFMDLEYQRDAVQEAKLKLGEYGGVFISDVVGLGKQKQNFKFNILQFMSIY